MQKRKTTPPWRSKLLPYQQEILDAWYHHRATLKMIQSTLAEKDVSISLSAISSFIRCRKRAKDPHIPEKPITIPSPTATTANADSLLDELTSKSLPELQKEWFKGKECQFGHVGQKK